MECPHCHGAVFRQSSDGTKLKAKTSILVIHKSGEVELNCMNCGRGVLIPLALKQGPFDLRKAMLVAPLRKP